MSASTSGSGGTPSTTQPIAGPWLSPQVVKPQRAEGVAGHAGHQGCGVKFRAGLAMSAASTAFMPTTW
jgi:hypothetical protein